MPTIYGALGIEDTDYVFQQTVGQRAIFDLTNEYVARYRAEQQAAQSLFVEMTTSDHTMRYHLPGSGYMQRRGTSGQPGAIKTSASWDVAFPLEDFGDAIALDDVTSAYMTAQKLQQQIDTILSRDANTRRFEILNALFTSTTRTFIDPIRSSLTIQPLANGDTVSFPPVIGSMTNATENHYLESGYAASAISDTNQYLVTIVNELEEHFGTPNGGSPIAVFINNAQTAKTLLLSDFIPVTNSGLNPGAQTATVTAIPAELTQGSWRVLGYDGTSGAWVCEWRWIPANYAIGIHLSAPKPLMERVDPADTGLGSGLQLVTRDIEFPFETSFWRDRFGYGVGNRLNGVAFEFGTGGTYTDPTLS
jgi:hypothetical protein